jgi:DNA-binding MarR family transcriptional regulator
MEDHVLLLQRLYPRIYIACHTDHVKAASSAVRLSARDSAILAHFRDSGVLQPSELARHLGIARSTMSQALKKLVSLGYVAVQKNPSDRRELSLCLTEPGRSAMQAASVLDYGKVKRLLQNLSPAQRQTSLDGLGLLAKAAGKMMLKANSGKMTPPKNKKEKL